MTPLDKITHIVPEQGGDGLEAHAAVDGLGGEGVAQLVFGACPMPALDATEDSAVASRDAVMRRPRSTNSSWERTASPRWVSHWSSSALSCGCSGT